MRLLDLELLGDEPIAQPNRIRCKVSAKRITIDLNQWVDSFNGYISFLTILSSHQSVGGLVVKSIVAIRSPHPVSMGPGFGRFSIQLSTTSTRISNITQIPGRRTLACILFAEETHFMCSIPRYAVQ